MRLLQVINHTQYHVGDILKARIFMSRLSLVSLIHCIIISFHPPDLFWMPWLAANKATQNWSKRIPSPVFHSCCWRQDPYGTNEALFHISAAFIRVSLTLHRSADCTFEESFASDCRAPWVDVRWLAKSPHLLEWTSGGCFAVLTSSFYEMLENRRT